MLLTALFAVTVAMALLPGNGVRAVLGRDADDLDVVTRERELGLDRPVYQRFWDWLTGVLRGDFGQTVRGESVGDLLATKVPNTLTLTGAALAVTVVASVAVAFYWTGGDRPRFDRAASVVTTVVIALPEFVVASIAVLVFALVLDVMPAVTVQDASGAPRDASMYVLPIMALAVPQIAWNSRVFVAAIREARAQPYVHAAELDGVGEARLLVHYIVPRALPAMLASLATTVGMVAGGAVVVESLFNFPGVGSVVAGSVGVRDVNVVLAVVACTGLAVMSALLAADAARAWTRMRAS
ncbi:MAG: ABC transporter permease [Actinomycetota bacterium]